MIKINLSEIAQYIIYCTEDIKYLYYYNDYFNKAYLYEQIIMNDDISKLKIIENIENYIFIRLCYDIILITENKKILIFINFKFSILYFN